MKSQSEATASLITTIALTIAEREGVEPTELHPPLYEVIDLDALAALFAPTGDGTPRKTGRVEFEYDGYDVLVEGDGDVVVEENDSQLPKSLGTDLR